MEWSFSLCIGSGGTIEDLQDIRNRIKRNLLHFDSIVTDSKRWGVQGILDSHSWIWLFFQDFYSLTFNQINQMEEIVVQETTSCTIFSSALRWFQFVSSFIASKI